MEIFYGVLTNLYNMLYNYTDNNTFTDRNFEPFGRRIKLWKN